MKKILILTKGIHASSSRERALVYGGLLSSDKVNYHHIGLSKRPLNYLKAIIKASSYDVIFLQRKLVPRFFFKILRIFSKKIIYDFDDAIFLNSDGGISNHKFKKFSYICCNSDLIFAGNEFLKKQAEKFNKKTFLLPTCLDISKYNLKAEKDKHFFDLVWIGSKSTSKYLIEIIPFLEKANEQLKDLRLINISDIKLESDLIKIKNVTWTEPGQYREIKSAKVGLAPLDNSNWSKGKCAFKLLQYASAGLPIVSSNFGYNSTLIKEYESGMLVNKGSDWVNNIAKLRSDMAIRKKYAKNALNMSKNFDININYKKMKKIIKDVL
jgi:glycosyltransferase involved in cell wall biosynthesis